jgi:hypothetical protein
MKYKERLKRGQKVYHFYVELTYDSLELHMYEDIVKTVHQDWTYTLLKNNKRMAGYDVYEDYEHMCDCIEGYLHMLVCCSTVISKQMEEVKASKFIGIVKGQ